MAERVFEAILVALLIAPTLWIVIAVGGIVATFLLFRGKAILSTVSMISSGLGSLVLWKIFSVECYSLNTSCKIYQMTAGWGLLFWWLVLVVIVSLLGIFRMLRSVQEGNKCPS